MSSKDSADSASDVREQNLRKLQRHLENLKQHGGKPPKEEAETGTSDMRSEIERAREKFAREFMEDFASWERLYGGDAPGPGGLPSARDRAEDFKLLGVSPAADRDEIRKAFYALAKQAHPDAGGVADHFRELMAAYRFLTDG